MRTEVESGAAPVVAPDPAPSVPTRQRTLARLAGVSQKQVATVAGVSQKTVSRVVNGGPNVSDDVRRRVMTAIEDLGYRPNAAARALVTQRTGAIGIITPATALYGPSAQLLGLERAAWAAGYSVLIVSVMDGSAEQFSAAVGRLLSSGVDGMLITSPIIGQTLSAPEVYGVPMMTVGDPPSVGSRLPAVFTDQQSGARAATEHLLDLGHRTVHHVAGPSSWYSASARAEAWRDALEQAGAPVPAPEHGDWSARSGYEAGRRLAEHPEVTAIFAANDHMAIGVLRALAEVGRRVPEDVSVVGFDDTPESGYLPVPLTTVRQVFEQMTARAVAELTVAVAGGQVTERTAFEPTLVIRASTGPPHERTASSPP